MSQFQLLVFDARRGNEEGEEADKILGFYPSTSDHDSQIALAGLVQGLLMFSGAVLPEDFQDSHIIENDNSMWIVHEAEPSIHLALLAGKSWLPRHVTQESLVGALRHIHHLMCLLFCSIQSLLDKDETAALARSSIESVLKHAGHDLADTTSWMSRELRNPYTAIGRAPMTTASTRTSLDVLSLCHRAQLAEVNGDRLIEDVVVVWKQAVLWSTLALEDTGRLSSLLGSPILEPASTRTWPPTAPSSSFKAAKNLQQLNNGFVVLRPEEVATDNNNNSQSDSAEGSHTLPFVYDTLSRLRHLLIYRTGQSMVMMLTRRGHEVFNSASLEAVLSAIEIPAGQLIARITEESQHKGGELGHLPGWRFSVREEASVRASPRSKVSAMSHHARAVGAALSDSLSRSHPSGNIKSKGNSRQQESIEDDDVDVAVQSCYGAWAIAKGDAATGKLSVVLREKRLDGGLAQSVAQLENSVRSLDLL